MKKTRVIVYMLLTFVLVACNSNLNFKNGVEGSGTIATEQRTINQYFDKIAASSGVTVSIEQGTPSAIAIETDDNILPYVITQVENETLVIKIEGSVNTMSPINVTIRMNSITGLESASGSKISTKNTLKGNTLNLKASSGGKINANFEYENVACESSSGSSITVAGKALTLKTSSSSGSKINAEELAANDIYAQASSGSKIIVKPIVKLDAKASSGSSIKYNQEPKIISKVESSGGSIKKE